MSSWRDWIPTPEGEPFVLCRRFPAVPGLWDLAQRPDVIPHWVAILRHNTRYLVEILAREGTPDRAAAVESVAAILEELFGDLESGSATSRVRTIHAVTQIRERLLRAHDLADPYAGIKRAEADRLLSGARTAIAEAWVAGARADAQATLTDLLARMLAGNLFDLGSRSTQAAFRRGALDTVAAAERFGPWVAARLDQLDRRAVHLLQPVSTTGSAEGRVLLFADNAGVDYLLGVLPAAAFWARRWEVWVVANSLPASSDITYGEACDLWERLCAPGATHEAAALRELAGSGRLNLIASGTGSPGIDLRYVDPQLNRIAATAAWVVLEGQGRGVETNWTTTFSCPVFRICVVKDPLVAQEIGCDAGGALLRWDP